MRLMTKLGVSAPIFVPTTMALSTGNFLFGERRILFVLDKSGSIEVQMGQSTALSIVTDNALRIFDCHIGIGDMFGVIMFNHTVDVSIPLQPVFDEACRIRMRQTLDSVRHHADGGTAMYTAVEIRHRFYQPDRRWYLRHGLCVLLMDNRLIAMTS